MDRRRFLRSGATLTLFAPAASRVFAAATDDARFALVILRGGLDGLAAVPPVGDDRYERLRGQLAIARPGADGGALELDGLFGLHPALGNLHGFYRDRELAVVHAIASPYRERSHFDGQKVLEAGGISPSTADGGWLNRALAALAGDNAGSEAIAIGDTVPLVLRGDVTVSAWSPSRLPAAGDDTLARIRALYEATDADAADRLQAALNARDTVGAVGMAGGGNGRQFESLATAAGRLLATGDGPRLAVLESGGWDTHANQGAATGVLATRLGQLDRGIARLRDELGPAWDQTTVLVVTEFGRTVAVNGTRGTDHGTAGVAFVAGGAVAGGRVIADWPGLAEQELLAGRDLRPTLDLRSLFKGALAGQFGLDARALDTVVFPDSADIAPLRIIRA